MQPEFKNIVSDIINKYLNFINPDELKNYLFTIISDKYDEGIVNGEVDFNRNFVPDYNTVSFLQNFAFENIKGLSVDLKDALRKEVSQGLMNGESVAKLKLRILDVMDASIQRAEMIVKTETNRAFNMGHYQAAKDSGLKVKKHWSAQPERTSRAGSNVPCHSCESMDGTIVKMDAMFKFDDGTQLLMPPKHPNCACRALYIQ